MRKCDCAESGERRGLGKWRESIASKAAVAVIQYSGSVTKSNWKGSTQNTATDNAALSEAGSRCGWEG